MLTTITLNVEEDDLTQWYQLAAEYHKNRKTFFEKRNGNVEREENSIKSGIPAKKEETMYNHITRSCTCGECYKALARPDRVPWRSVNGTYVNSKHGKYTPPKRCSAPMHPLGYIYEKAGKPEIKDQRKEPTGSWRALPPKTPAPPSKAPDRVHPAPKFVNLKESQPPTPEKKSQPIQKKGSTTLLTIAQVKDRTTLQRIAEFIHKDPLNWPDYGVNQKTREEVKTYVLNRVDQRESTFRQHFGAMRLGDFATAFFSSYKQAPYNDEKCDYAQFADLILEASKSINASTN